MNKWVLRKIVKSNFVRAFVLIGLVIFIGGCATKLLDNRGSIPPATLAPPDNANEIVSNMPADADTDITLPIASFEEITISKDNIQPGDLHDFPEIKTEAIMYKVEKGDSFWKIARMYGVGMKELAAHNNMDLKKPLKAGETLEIPPGGKLKSNDELTPIKPHKNVKKLSPVTADAKDGVYTVKPGDSLWLIARMYNTNVN
jgi:LysM repeat protein